MNQATAAAGLRPAQRRPVITTQAQAKVQSDDNQIQRDQANLATLEATEVNPGSDLHLAAEGGRHHPARTSRSTSVSNQPVPLLYGSVAAYRAFYVGMSDGADVGQLTHDLIALGYGAGLTQSNHYSSATATAVRALADRPRPARHRRRSCSARWSSSPAPSGSPRSRPSVGASAGGGGGSGRRGHGADGHQHHPHRHRRPGRDPGVPGQAGRRGDRSCCPTAPPRSAAGSRRSATWPPARAAAAAAPATAAARPTSRPARPAAAATTPPRR